MTTSPILPAEVNWHCLRYDELTRDDLYDLLHLRSEVFVVEQACPYLDPDGKDRDPAARHLLGRRGDGMLVAYARLLPPGVSYGEASFGRVVTSISARGTGLGHALMIEALRHTDALWPHDDVQIGAQSHLAGYYAKHGFAVCSEIYDEDGIPHVHMRRSRAR